jgi:predicted transposase/invertase (TIGR01784 family)
VIDEKADLFLELKPRLRSWANFFHYANKKSEVEMTTLLDNPVTKRAYEKYKQFNQDEKMRAIDNAHQQYLHDYATDIGSAHRKGLAEGEAKGEAKRNLEIAVNLKQMGFSSADIAKATNLSIAEIEGLT